METTAEADLKERIGFVESWGRPETLFILPMEETPEVPKKSAAEDADESEEAPGRNPGKAPEEAGENAVGAGAV
jgi:hypothetical protein